ncbi:DUF1804 family protein [Moraxella osloensis]|nr:DUF1804 family protein [Moraxella osloensis]UAY37038.1 DUF1804 family protein [Moraxella osloensis]
MAHDKDKKQTVRKMYVFDGISLTTCAVMAEISYSTVQRWKNDAKKAGDDWDAVRAAHTLAGGDLEDISRQIMTEFVIAYKAQMEKLNFDETLTAKQRVEMLASLADSYVKTVAANKKTMPQTSKLAVAFEVLDKFKDYVMQNAPEIAPKFAEMLVPFGEQMEKELK